MARERQGNPCGDDEVDDIYTSLDINIRLPSKMNKGILFTILKLWKLVI